MSHDVQRLGLSLLSVTKPIINIFRIFLSKVIESSFWCKFFFFFAKCARAYDSWKQCHANAMPCFPFQSTGRPISHWNGWSFWIYMIPLQGFVPEWNSRPCTRTRVNSQLGDSCRHNILWWYCVNKYRAMRGNWSELAQGRKSLRCHVNTP